jgi:hypothetical protein
MLMLCNEATFCKFTNCTHHCPFTIWRSLTTRIWHCIVLYLLPWKQKQYYFLTHWSTSTRPYSIRTHMKVLFIIISNLTFTHISLLGIRSYLDFNWLYKNSVISGTEVNNDRLLNELRLPTVLLTSVRREQYLEIWCICLLHSMIHDLWSWHSIIT